VDGLLLEMPDDTYGTSYFDQHWTRCVFGVFIENLLADLLVHCC
jgi:hypothetical protein